MKVLDAFRGELFVICLIDLLALFLIFLLGHICRLIGDDPTDHQERCLDGLLLYLRR